MKKTLVIFDIDGTLLYSNRADSRCFADTWESNFGQPFPSINWLDYPHVTDTTIFNEVFREQFDRLPETVEVEDFKRAFVGQLKEARRANPDNFREVPGAGDTLNKLREQPGFCLGIATGGFELPARLKLSYLGMDTRGMHMSFADDKPTREEIIHTSLSSAELEHGKFEHIVYIGDAIWDVRTTRNLRMNFVGIRRRGDAHFLYEAGARTVLKDYMDFDQFLQAIYEAKPPV
ncbi:MAG: HAD family hydrolase [Bacteroidetes bacterium]|nr:HAD family hydrolase [Bacteroidota bacterium]